MSTLNLSDHAREIVLRSLLQDDKHGLDTVRFTLVATLLREVDDDHSQTEQIIKALLDQSKNGQADGLSSSLRQQPWLMKRYLTAAAGELKTLSSSLASSSTPKASRDVEGAIKDITNLIDFAKKLVNSNLSEATARSLLASATVYLHVTDRSLSKSARDLLCLVFPLLPLDEELLDQLLRLIEILLAEPSKRNLGFSIWLPMVIKFPASVQLERLERAEYWSYIRNGLRHGDSERQKLCMEILRQSVTNAVDHDRLDLVATKTDATASTVKAQYASWLTVYETIALSNFSSLVAEVDTSLSALVSVSSVIPEELQYLLFEVGLQQSMQDQIRRYLGKWVLSGKLASEHNTSRFITFLCKDLLAWMIEGSLYNATITLSHDATYHCAHGEQVSQHIRDVALAQTSSAAFSELIDGLISFFTTRPGVFAYAIVYIVDGLAQASRELTPSLSEEQTASLVDIISQQKTSTEVKTYMSYCCSKLRGVEEQEHASSEESSTVLSTSVQDETTVGLSAKTRSRRDVILGDLVEKCSSTISACEHRGISVTIEHLRSIWAEAQRMKFPRQLMVCLPHTFINEHIIQLISDNHGQTDELQDLVRTVVQRILEQTQTKSFLLAPLCLALRCTVLRNSDSANVLGLHDIIVQIAQSPPEPKKDIRFEYASLHLQYEMRKRLELNDVLIKPVAPENEGYAAYLDLVSRLGNNQELVLALSRTVVARWLKQKIPPPTVSAFKTTLQLQILVLCCEQLSVQTSSEVIRQLVDDLFKLLSIEPLPRYRLLFSWALLRLLQRFAEHQEQLISMLATHEHHDNPKYLAALMKLSVDLLRITTPNQSFPDRLAHCYVALSASSKIIIRHEAQWSFPMLMDLARANGWTSMSTNSAHQALEQYIRSLPRFGDPPKERLSSDLDLSRHATMTNLVEGQWTELDYSRPAYTRREDLEALLRKDDMEGLSDIPQSCLPIGDPIIHDRQDPVVKDTFEPPSILVSSQTNQEQAIALQTKGSAYLRMLLDGTKQTKTASLIVIATLLDNPHNLGGLSRVSEIFGAQALYVRDPRIIGDKDFMSLAVSSYNHIDIMPLAVEGIPAFLAEKRKEGWVAVGVEQTDRSVLLGEEHSLPEKAILIIGNERAGMPGTIINECDILVEIPQKGITRSMNVQTVAAVVLYEYNRQYGRN